MGRDVAGWQPALLGLAALSCGAVRGADLAAVREQVGWRTAIAARAIELRPEETQVEHRTRALLADELSVDAAVELALLNNRRLQVAYGELGVARADLVQAGLLLIGFV